MKLWIASLSLAIAVSPALAATDGAGLAELKDAAGPVKIAVAEPAAPVAVQEAAPGEPGVSAPIDQSIETRVGQTFEITLPAQFGAGYSWRVARTDEQLLKLREGYPRIAPHRAPPIDPRRGPAVGGFDGEVFAFEATAAGTVELTLEYVHPWEHNPPEKVYRVEVRIQSAARENVIHIRNEDGGRTIHAKKGDTLAIWLEAEADWKPFRISDPDASILENTHFTPPVRYGVSVANFKAIKEGATSINAMATMDCPPDRACPAMARSWHVDVIVE